MRKTKLKTKIESSQKIEYFASVGVAFADFPTRKSYKVSL